MATTAPAPAPAPAPVPATAPAALDLPPPLPGFRFFPTDAELLVSYLHPKTLNLPLPPLTASFIAAVDIYAHPPWRLPALSPIVNTETEWYFFTAIKPKNRRTGEGFWKSCSFDTPVFEDKRKVGMKKTLVYYSGDSTTRTLSEWVMKEYRLDEDGRTIEGPIPVLCRIYRKGIGHRRGGRSKPAAASEGLDPTRGDLAVGGVDQEKNATIGSELSSSKPNDLATICSFAPGFRFHPTDVELVSYYLKHKISGLPIHIDAIVEVDLYKWAPWDLPSLSHRSSVKRDLESYFFCTVDRKYMFGYVSHRLTPQGFWKSTACDRPIYHGTKMIGLWKTLVFYAGRSPCGQKTNWIMHEYRLGDEQSYSTSYGSPFVLCKIFLQKERASRRQRAKSVASFIEEEKVEAEQDMVLAGEASVTPEVSTGNARDQDHMDTQDLQDQVEEEHDLVLAGEASATHEVSTVNAQDQGHMGTQDSEQMCEEQVEAEQDLVLSREASATHEVSSENAQDQDHTGTQDFEEGMAITMFDIGSRIEVANVKKDIPVAWYMAIIMKVIDEKLFLVEYESLRKCDTSKRGIVSSRYIRPRRPPNLEVKSFAHLDEVEAFYKNGWWPGVIAKVNDDSRYNVKFMQWEEEIEFSHNELRLLYDWVDGQWIQASQDKAINLPNLGVTTSVSHIKLVHASNIAHTCKEPDLIVLSSGGEDETLCVPISATNSENDNSERLTFQRELELQPCRQAENEKLMEDDTKLSGVRGTETCSALKTGFDVCTPIINEEPVIHIKSLVEKWRAEFKKADASVVDCITQPSSNILRPLESIQQSVSLQSTEQRRELTHEHQSRGDEVAIENNAGEKRRKDDGPQNLRINDSSVEGDSRRNQQNNDVVDMPPTEGLSRATPQSGTCSHNSQEAEDQSNASVSRSEEDENGVILPTTGGNNSKKARIEKSTNASEPRLDELPPKQSPLPFDKCSPMWNSIESLEIFRILPQQPHFRPLETYNKEFREGMAIGLMVTFSNVVKSISKLRIDDPRHKFEEMLKTLVQLEEQGFNVHCIRARIKELLRMKENRERLVDEESKLEVLLAKKKRKKEQLHANFESVEKAARVLEVSLSHFYKEKDYILERKRESESELDKVEIDSRTVEEALRSSKNDFEATLTAAW